jgi:hypothetical protein
LIGFLSNKENLAPPLPKRLGGAFVALHAGLKKFYTFLPDKKSAPFMNALIIGSLFLLLD